MPDDQPTETALRRAMKADQDFYNPGLSDVRPDSQSSVEVERNTRGVNWKVKVYAADPDVAFAKATDLDDRLRQRYLATPPPMTKAEDKAPPASPPAAKRVPRRRA